MTLAVASARSSSRTVRYVFYLTVDELTQMNAELHEVMMRWSRLDGRLEHPDRRPRGSVPVEALLFDYPIEPGRPATGSGDENDG
jgi:hypothetical protein